MFGYFANNLTRKSNNLIDWSRIGELVASGNHRYSNNEIITRASIVMFTATCGFMAAYLNDEEKTGFSNSTLAIAMGTLGFVVSHGIVIYPLYQKRLAMQDQCHAYIDEIQHEFCNNPHEPLSQAVNRVIAEIMACSLANETRSNASQTWGHRLSLLQKLQCHLQWLACSNQLSFYIKHPVASLISELDMIDLHVIASRKNTHSR